ncbi:MAG: hypothetical protein Q4D05_07320 [Acinetobacter sp.]|nr:hypothetical protein [Acinetobacter sp.]
MDGFIISLCMLLMIVIFMLIQKWVFPRLGIENNKASRAVLCFIVIAGAISLHEFLQGRL